MLTIKAKLIKDIVYPKDGMEVRLSAGESIEVVPLDSRLMAMDLDGNTAEESDGAFFGLNLMTGDHFHLEADEFKTTDQLYC